MAKYYNQHFVLPYFLSLFLSLFRVPIFLLYSLSLNLTSYMVEIRSSHALFLTIFGDMGLVKG